MNSDHLSKSRLAQAFTPTLPELIMSFIVSFLFLILINSFQFVRKIGEQYHQFITEYLDHRINEFLGRIDSFIPANLLLMAAWAFVGMMVYLLLWFVIGTWHVWKSDNPVAGEHMIVPKEFNHAKVLRGSIAHTFIRLISCVLVLAWVVLFFTRILPFASSRFLEAINPIRLTSILDVFLATICVAGFWFVLTVLLRCCVLRVRVFS